MRGLAERQPHPSLSPQPARPWPSPEVALAPSIEQVPLSSLKPWDRNPRNNDDAVDRLAGLIESHGFLNPIIASPDGTIRAGHTRYKAALQLKLATVPVVFVDFKSEAQAAAFALADNKSSEWATWDFPSVATMLQELVESAVPLPTTGFTPEELERMLADSLPPGGNTDPDDVPDLPVDPITRPGDLWILGEHRLLCGDSTSVTAVERLLAGEKAEMLWTDPPYNVAYEGAAGKIMNDDMSASAFLSFLQAAFACAWASLKPGGAAYVAHADTERINFTSAFRNVGFKLSGVVIWRKNALVLGRSDYQWQHEPILYGWKPGAAHRWHGRRNKTTMAEFDGAAVAPAGEDAWTLRVGEEVYLIRGEGLTVEQAVGTVLSMDKPRKNGQHPTMKPVALVEGQIRNSSEPGELVLDLFGGSGSTLMACELSRRKARLMELDPRFCDVIVRRWEEFTGQKAQLEAARG